MPSPSLSTEATTTKSSSSKLQPDHRPATTATRPRSQKHDLPPDSRTNHHQTERGSLGKTSLRKVRSGRTQRHQILEQSHQYGHEPSQPHQPTRWATTSTQNARPREPSQVRYSAIIGPTPSAVGSWFRVRNDASQQAVRAGPERRLIVQGAGERRVSIAPRPLNLVHPEAVAADVVAQVHRVLDEERVEPVKARSTRDGEARSTILTPAPCNHSVKRDGGTHPRRGR